jgi:hypothetical protein
MPSLLFRHPVPFLFLGGRCSTRFPLQKYFLFLLVADKEAGTIIIVQLDRANIFYNILERPFSCCF